MHINAAVTMRHLASPNAVVDPFARNDTVRPLGKRCENFKLAHRQVNTYALDESGPLLGTQFERSDAELATAWLCRFGEPCSRHFGER